MKVFFVGKNCDNRKIETPANVRNISLTCDNTPTIIYNFPLHWTPIVLRLHQECPKTECPFPAKFLIELDRPRKDGTKSDFITSLTDPANYFRLRDPSDRIRRCPANLPGIKSKSISPERGHSVSISTCSGNSEPIFLITGRSGLIFLATFSHWIATLIPLLIQFPDSRLSFRVQTFLGITIPTNCYTSSGFTLRLLLHLRKICNFFKGTAKKSLNRFENAETWPETKKCSQNFNFNVYPWVVPFNRLIHYRLPGESLYRIFLVPSQVAKTSFPFSPFRPVR